MPFRLTPNAYLVSGARNYCIYDLQEGRLFNLGHSAGDLLCQLLSSDANPSCLGPLQRSALDALRRAGLVSASERAAEVPSIRKLATQPRITLAWIEATRSCNLRCVHCYESSVDKTASMSLPDLRRVAVELREIGVDRVQLIGGEPLVLGEILRDMVDVCVEHFGSVEVFTNATLLDDHWAAFFRDRDVRIAASVYSSDPRWHDHVTGFRGSHARTMRGLSHCRALGLVYRVCAVKIGRVPQQLDLALSRQPEQADPVRLSGRASLSLYDLDLFREKAISKGSFRRPLTLRFVQRLVSGHNCFGNRLYVDSDLDVYPCVMERRRCHGNIRTSSLRTVLKPDILGFTKDHVQVCRICEYRYACFDCRPDSITGVFSGKPWYCLCDPETAQWEPPDEAWARLSAT